MSGIGDLGNWGSLASPLVEFGFMRRALVACFALSLSSAPVGVLLVLRRMSLIGDAMAHAVLPGAALGFVVAGLSLPAMSLGGFVGGLIVAGLAGLTSRWTAQKEDASFAAFYLIALAAGVMIISAKGSSVDLMHVLFGSILAVDDMALSLMAGVAIVTLVTLSLLYRPLVCECADPDFFRTVSRWGGPVHLVFMALVVLNLVAGFLALGTLMAVGLMMLPAASARFWARSLPGLVGIAVLLALISSAAGLLVSFHANLPSGPAIVLCAGALFGLSLLLGQHDSLRAQWLLAMRHKEA
ncbi:MAG: metal ABC transporter permease [Aquabacterium sp.]